MKGIVQVKKAALPLPSDKQGGDEQLKVADVEGLCHGIETALTELDKQQNQFETIESDILTLVNMDNALQGEAGEAIRSFYEEYHLPFLKLLVTFLGDYKQKLSDLKEALMRFDSGANGYLRQDFLEDEVDYGLNTARMVTIALTNETNLLIDSVSDIIHLPKLHDNQFLEAVNDAKLYRNHTMSDLHEFDFRQTSAFEPLENDLILLKRYIDQMRQTYNKGNLSIVNRDNNSLKDEEIYQELLAVSQ